MIKTSLIALALGLLASHATAGPLHGAARDGDIEQVKSLIASGEDVNKRDRNLGWPLHQAALNDFVEIARLLIAEGADVNVEHRVFGTPLYSAAQRGAAGAAAILAANGANPDIHASNGLTALHVAAAGGHFAVVEILVGAGADVNIRTDRPNPGAGDYLATHAAALNRRFDMVALLRSFGSASPSVEPIAELLATADVGAGQKAFESGGPRCIVCHTLDTDPKGPPRLGDVFGRTKASVAGFEYSEALQRLGGIWTAAELNAFLAAPSDYAPGTAMLHAGVVDAGVRANIIAYLRAISE